jgi:betaine-aldehyde dehydrogenase
VPGGADVGRQLSEDPRVDGIAFTGSTFVGSEVMRMAAATIKKVALELGGKNANIVFADSNLSRAAESAAASGFGNAGQSCSARSRLIVERAAMPAFVDLFRQAAAKLRFGAVDDPATSLGPLITARHRAHVAGCVETAHTSGARILSGGKPGAGDGFFYEATILGDVLASNPVFSDEVFGPVVSITPFDTEVEAIALANASEYGLNGSVWARDIGKALRVARGVRTGMMAVNGLPSASRTSVYAPFGGVKRSGIGRELGLNALDFYTEVKNVVIDLG